jgi:hypothetical protein
MEKFDAEASSPDKGGESEKNKTEGMSRRRFLKLLGASAMAATGSMLDAGRAAAETAPSKGFQIVDGRAVLWTFDPKGSVESYEIIGAVSDLGLSSKETDVLFSPEVIQAAGKVIDTAKRCRAGDVDACRSMGLAHADLSDAIRVHRDVSSSKLPSVPTPRTPFFKPPPPATKL